MNDYQGVFEKSFVRNFHRYASIRKQIQRRVDHVLSDPYFNTELLGDRTGGINLLGCRSARIDRNFRIIFVICEECRSIPTCEYCFCDDLDDETVIFLTVGPHGRAYAMR